MIGRAEGKGRTAGEGRTAGRVMPLVLARAAPLLAFKVSVPPDTVVVPV